MGKSNCHSNEITCEREKWGKVSVNEILLQFQKPDKCDEDRKKKISERV